MQYEKANRFGVGFLFSRIEAGFGVKRYFTFSTNLWFGKVKTHPKNDNDKMQKCRQAEIKLYIIDVSNEPHLTKEIR